MRPLLIEWLELRGWPGWLAPSYATMVGLVAVLGAALVLRRTARDHDDVRGAAGTLIVGYVGALAGGYVYEWLRATPEALATLSIAPYYHIGRAAYGGLLFGTLAVAIDLHRRRASVGAFLDRVALALGLVFLMVRTGCLLEGCDYGVPSDGWLAVSYPAGSPAAVDHAQHGWIALGTASLFTHPTQIYEGVVALLASGLAWLVLEQKRARHVPSGVAFLGWLLVYAIGRAAVETLRGDAERGVYAGLSSAQWTSLVLSGCAVVGLTLLYSRRPLTDAGGLHATR